MRFPAFWEINSGQKSVVLSFIEENVAFIQLLIYQPDNQLFLQPMNKWWNLNYALLHVNKLVKNWLNHSVHMTWVKNQWAFMKTHNYVFIQIVWCIFGYDVIQTVCFFFLEKSSRLLWAKKQAHVSSAVGAYWNPCVLNRKFNKKWNNYICPFILLPHGSFRLSNFL